MKGFRGQLIKPRTISYLISSEPSKCQKLPKIPWGGVVSSETNFDVGTIWTADNLKVMRGINSDTVDLIYLDPPFNSDKKWQKPMEGKLQLNLDVLIKAGANSDPVLYKKWSKYVDENRDSQDRLIMKFDDDAWDMNTKKEEMHETRIREQYPALHQIIEAVGESHGDPMKAYLIFMGLRLIEMYRILKPTGSLYLHCDPTAGHYLKILLDCIFKGENFRNEVVWSYRRWTGRAKMFIKMHDTIFRYTKSRNFTFNVEYIESLDSERFMKGFVTNTANGVKQLIVYDREKAKFRIEKARKEGRKVVFAKRTGTALGDVWTDINVLHGMSKERTGYPTQKPVALLRRIIKASTKEGDIVFDPFCGCATAIVAAHDLGRRWIGCDLSFITVPLVRYRLKAKARTICKYKTNSTSAPVRTDIAKEILKPRLRSSLTPSQRTEVKEHYFGKQRGVCNGCGHFYDYKIFELDHIKAKSKGGTDEMDNFQLLCGPCNSRKGAKDESECMWMFKFKKDTDSN